MRKVKIFRYQKRIFSLLDQRTHRFFDSKELEVARKSSHQEPSHTHTHIHTHTHTHTHTQTYARSQPTDSLMTCHILEVSGRRESRENRETNQPTNQTWFVGVNNWVAFYFSRQGGGRKPRATGREGGEGGCRRGIILCRNPAGRWCA